jgi:hypothetical protein
MRILFSRKWDEAIQPLTKIDPATGKFYDMPKAKRMAKKLVDDAREAASQIHGDATQQIKARLDNVVDPNVTKQLGGRSAWQVMQDTIKKKNPNTEALSTMKEALDVLPDDQIPRFMRQLDRTKGVVTARRVEELRASSMLWGVGTLMRNMGTTLLNIGTQVPVTATAGLVDVGRTAFKKEAARQIYAGEAAAQLYGMFKGLPKALREFGKEARAVRELVDPERMSAFGPKAGLVTTLPFRALAASDSWLFKLAFNGEMWRTAYRRAIREGKRGTKAFDRAQQILNSEADMPGNVVRKHIEEAKAKLAAADFPIEEVPTIRRDIVRKALAESGMDEIDDALELAERTIFTAREGRAFDKVMSSLDDINRNTRGAVSLAAPFRRTPGNLMREALRLSPMGFLTAAKRARGAGAARQISQEIGRAALGSSALAATWMLIDSGLLEITPFDRSKSKAQRTTEQSLGTVSDGVTVAGLSIPVDRLEPLGSLLLATARAHERIRNNPNLPPKEQSNILTILGTEFPLAMANQTFLDDFADLIEAVDDPVRADVLARKWGVSYIPQILKERTRAFDPRPKKRPDSFVQAVEQAVGLKEGIPKPGLFGETPERVGGLASVAGGQIGRTKSDPLVELMLRVGAVHGPPETDIFEDKEVVLSDAEETALVKAKGTYQRYRLTTPMNKPGFNRLPPERQKKLLDNEFNKAGTRINKRARRSKKWNITLDRRKLLQGLMKELL